MPTLIELPVTSVWVLRLINLSVDRGRRSSACAEAGSFIRWRICLFTYKGVHV